MATTSSGSLVVLRARTLTMSLAAHRHSAAGGTLSVLLAAHSQCCWRHTHSAAGGTQTDTVPLAAPRHSAAGGTQTQCRWLAAHTQCCWRHPDTVPLAGGTHTITLESRSGRPATGQEILVINTQIGPHGDRALIFVSVGPLFSHNSLWSWTSSRSLWKPWQCSGGGLPQAKGFLFLTT